MDCTTRRRFLGSAGGAAALAGLPVGADAKPKEPVNLLFLMTDQHHHRALGCMGHPAVKTPHLDRLAAQGVRFTHATCPVPFCSPTRAAIVTGRYPSTLGFWRNVRPKDDPLRFREPRTTLYHQLAAKGYRCHHLGKWHLGHQKELDCFAEGEKDVAQPHRLLAQRRQAAGQAKFDPGPREGEELIGQVFMTRHTAARHRVWRDETRRSRQDLSILGRSRVKAEYHYESVLADYCIELLRRHRREPFAITWSVSPPHAYWTAPARFYDLYDPATLELPANWTHRPPAWQRTQPARMGKLFGEQGLREYLRCYYAQVTMMDWCIGRILDALDRLGLADRTLVVFTSDHGDMQAGHGMMGKSMPGFYDEVLRVPLLLRLPGVLRAGSTPGPFACSVDLAPTILDVLGAEPLPGVHGRSLRRVIDGAPDDGRPAFCERGQPGSRACSRMVRTRRWKLCVAGTGRRELFDLAADPGEQTNLADRPEHAATVAELLGKLKAHRERIRDPALPTLLRRAT